MIERAPDYKSPLLAGFFIGMPFAWGRGLVYAGGRAAFTSKQPADELSVGACITWAKRSINRGLIEMASNFKKNLCSALIIIEAIVFLLPLSWLCGMGLASFSTGLFSNVFSGSEWLDRRFWGEGAWLLAGGYALGALWWLVFTHRSTLLAEVPRVVWGGIVVGCAIALYQLYDLLHKLHVADKASIFELVFPGVGIYIDWAWRAGPLLLLLTLLLAIPMRRPQAPPDLPLPSRRKRLMQRP